MYSGVVPAAGCRILGGMKNLGVIVTFSLSATIFATACGGGDPATADAGGPGDVDAAGAADAAIPEGWTQLIGRTWSLPAGQPDTYKCIRIQLAEDLFIAGFRSQAPLGSHHAVVTLADGGALGEYDCQVGSLDTQMLYASGVGTDDLLFPDGVAMRLRAGQTVNLNLHLFNASDEPLSGSSGVLVRTMTEAEVVQEADMIFAGTQRINIPGNGQPYSTQGGCTLSRSYQAFALWPHMHQYATHQRVTVTRGGNTTVLLDEPFAFTEQRNYPQVTPISFQAGDQVQTTCTYVNDTGSAVGFGDSSNAEMCFTGMYRYPAGGFLFECVTF